MLFTKMRQQKAMNRYRGTLLILCTVMLLLTCAGCSQVDRNYGVSSESPTATAKSSSEGIKVPQIKSSDTVMPIYFDISLYDEENYADIYLGKNYKFKITYAGSQLNVPTTYREMSGKGWNFVELSDYDMDSQIMAGETVQVQLVNEYNKQITAIFYNPSNSSVKLQKCNIVKLIIPENSLNKPDSVYDQFWINGVTNQSAITDIIEYFGAPSHFYAMSPEQYYLDYFMTEDDKRNGITVYINPADDSITSVEIANYKK